MSSLLERESSARELLDSFNTHAELGLKAVGFLSDAEERVGQVTNGLRVIATFEGLHEVLRQQKIDQVYIALPFHQHEKIRHILSSLKNELVDIKVVSDLYDFIRLGGGVDDLDGLPIINIQDTPLHGWGKIAKKVTRYCAGFRRDSCLQSVDVSHWGGDQNDVSWSCVL